MDFAKWASAESFIFITIYCCGIKHDLHLLDSALESMGNANLHYLLSATSKIIPRLSFFDDKMAQIDAKKFGLITGLLQRGSYLHSTGRKDSLKLKTKSMELKIN